MIKAVAGCLKWVVILAVIGGLLIGAAVAFRSFDKAHPAATTVQSGNGKPIPVKPLQPIQSSAHISTGSDGKYNVDGFTLTPGQTYPGEMDGCIPGQKVTFSFRYNEDGTFTDTVSGKSFDKYAKMLTVKTTCGNQYGVVEVLNNNGQQADVKPVETPVKQ